MRNGKGCTGIVFLFVFEYDICERRRVRVFGMFVVYIFVFHWDTMLHTLVVFPTCFMHVMCNVLDVCDFLRVVLWLVCAYCMRMSNALCCPI